LSTGHVIFQHREKDYYGKYLKRPAKRRMIGLKKRRISRWGVVGWQRARNKARAWHPTSQNLPHTDTRLNIVFFLLKKNGITARIPRDEMPVMEEEVAVPCTDTELTQLFAAMDDEERIRYKFFLGSSCRDKEMTFAAWNDPR
jgi:hypothetical protein